jgi:hypothetical protein
MHVIAAFYVGDANFSGSTSAFQSTEVQQPSAKVRGTVTATMQWRFHFTRSYTTVDALVVNGALHATVSVQCHGRGCPFATQSAVVKSTQRCHQGRRRTCPTHGTLDLTSKFRNRRLSVGAQFTVTIVRSSWIGKYYGFTVQRSKGPRIRIACLAPAARRPGVGC